MFCFGNIRGHVCIHRVTTFYITVITLCKLLFRCVCMKNTSRILSKTDHPTGQLLTSQKQVYLAKLINFINSSLGVYLLEDMLYYFLRVAFLHRM